MTNRTLTNQAASTTLSKTTLTRSLRRVEDSTVFGYESPPDTPTLHRDVFKWVQGLDLSQSLKNCRRCVPSRLPAVT
jgi:hypothetical protein